MWLEIKFIIEIIVKRIKIYYQPRLELREVIKALVSIKWVEVPRILLKNILSKIGKLKSVDKMRFVLYTKDNLAI